MTAEIILWHRHRRTPLDETGIAFCTVCEAWEGAMSTDCPGRPMTDREMELVLSGEIDYRVSHGGWTTYTRRKEMHIHRHDE